MSPSSQTPEPMTDERRAEIQAALAAIPAPPWRWIGLRNAGGPKLVTNHSGQQYLLRAAKPVDHRGDELLDPIDGGPVYGDLAFRDRRGRERYATMRTGSELAIGRTEYDPDTIVGVDNPVAHWIQHSAQYATDLLAENERLRARVAQLSTAATSTAVYLRSTAERIHHGSPVDPDRMQAAARDLDDIAIADRTPGGAA